MGQEGSEREPMVVEITQAIANAEGVSPADLELTLQNHIDVDAIESLSMKEDSEWSLRFSVPDHMVHIDSTGSISVE